MLVEGIRSLSVMENLLEEGYADLIFISRPLIYEPDLVSKLKSGNSKRAMCASCNLCFDLKGVRCSYEFDQNPGN